MFFLIFNAEHDFPYAISSQKKNIRFYLHITAAHLWFIYWSAKVWMMSSWCHQMESFSTLLALCAGNSPVTGEFPSQRPVTQSFDVFNDLPLDKRWSKQLIRQWFETPSHSLWHHCNVIPGRWHVFLYKLQISLMISSFSQESMC